MGKDGYGQRVVVHTFASWFWLVPPLAPIPCGNTAGSIGSRGNLVQRGLGDKRPVKEFGLVIVE